MGQTSLTVTGIVLSCMIRWTLSASPKCLKLVQLFRFRHQLSKFVRREHGESITGRSQETQIRNLESRAVLQRQPSHLEDSSRLTAQQTSQIMQVPNQTSEQCKGETMCR